MLDPLGPGVRGSCEACDVGAENRASVLSKSGVGSELLSHRSGPGRLCPHREGQRIRWFPVSPLLLGLQPREDQVTWSPGRLTANLKLSCSVRSLHL